MILHVDMDAFYASVEQRDRPELRGRPVVVGGDPHGRGVVSAASYQARRFGVHSAMPAAAAARLCPQAVFVPPRIDHYARVSRQIHRIFQRYTPLVEPLALDEAFLDVRGSEGLFGPAEEIGHRIKQDIRDQLRLVASVGVAPNKFLAKVASDLDKPDGFVVVPADGVQAFLDPLPVETLWGVGRVGGQAFQRLGVDTIGRLRRLAPQDLRRQFGSLGDHLWQLAHGVDPRPVVPDHQAKSISHETTFKIDVRDAQVLRAWLLELTEQVARRVRAGGLRGRTVHLKVRFADFRTITRNHTLPEPTDVTEEIWQAVAGLFRDRVPAQHPPVRLLGMGLSGFDRGGQRQRLLFDQPEQGRQSRLDEVTDEIRARWGRSAIGRAGSAGRIEPPP